ncbi:MAG: UDP-N-acetylglucosamine 2-epimerase (non-hydrolyzing) [Sphingobacteriales bacterium]|jgi:UDP-N-acetylglucosamine 2-epimerase (non-hydrolysing)
MPKILFVLGTRPEAIKLCPLIKEAIGKLGKQQVRVVHTGQHMDLAKDVFDVFNVFPDVSLNLMKENQDLVELSARIALGLKNVLISEKPDFVIVQGDTTSAFIGAYVAHLAKIEVVHVEAGLRSGDIWAPFPEESNRKMIAAIAQYHFAPTKSAQQTLEGERVLGKVWCVGNTGIDALLQTAEHLKFSTKPKHILLTIHRRENFGEPLQHILEAVSELLKRDPEITFFVPVHPNPNVFEFIHQKFDTEPRVVLSPPLSYPQMIEVMQKAWLILSDSGGIQEEAPSLNTPVLVLRERTERPEAIEAGTAILVGSSKDQIVDTVLRLLATPSEYDAMITTENPFGDGKASQRIIEILCNE